MHGNIKISVIDKDNNKVVWTERHETLESAHHAVKIMKYYNFNPNYFLFKIEEVQENE